MQITSGSRSKEVPFYHRCFSPVSRASGPEARNKKLPVLSNEFSGARGAICFKYHTQI